MDYPEKCNKCKKKHCKKDCPALIKMRAIKSRSIKKWAREHNKLHNQIGDEFSIFSLKCKHGGMVINDILPRVGRCFHDDAANYTQRFTNCYMSRCPVLKLKG